MNSRAPDCRGCEVSARVAPPCDKHADESDRVLRIVRRLRRVLGEITSVRMDSSAWGTHDMDPSEEGPAWSGPPGGLPALYNLDALFEILGERESDRGKSRKGS
jgi:hypothetical protein